MPTHPEHAPPTTLRHVPSAARTVCAVGLVLLALGQLVPTWS